MDAILVAEKSAEAAGNSLVESTHLEGYEVRPSRLGKRMKEVIKIMSAWERWMPGREKRDLVSRVRYLKETSSRLSLHGELLRN